MTVQPATAVEPFQKNQLWHQDVSGIQSVAEANDNFGRVLASGDFDGNGYADLAIFSKEYFGETNYVGSVHVLYGAETGFNKDDDHWHRGVEGLELEIYSWDGFGVSLTCGDFNGDGYEDLALGVPLSIEQGTDESFHAGKVLVLYGSSSGLQTAGHQIWDQNADIQDQAESGDKFGSSLTAADFNGDGYEDLAVGAPEEHLRTEEAGVVHVLYGSETGLHKDGNQVWHHDVPGIHESIITSQNLGRSLIAGDFNNDRYADLVIGVPSHTEYWNNTGTALVLYGSSWGLQAEGHQVWHQGEDGLAEDAEDEDHFGETFAVGDFNGDGYSDLAIGAPWDDVDATDKAGVVNVLYGASSGLEAAENQLWHHSVDGIERGYGSPDLADQPGVSLAGQFGASLAAGDFNLDGFDDLAIGSPYESFRIISGDIGNVGVVNVLFGTSTGLDVTGSQLWHQDVEDTEDHGEQNDFFGRALAVGDFDGDGMADLAIGVSGEDLEDGTRIKDAGAVQVLLSGLSRLVYPHVDIAGSWSTEVCVVNNLPTPVSGTFTAYAPWGDTVGRQMEVTIAPHGRLALDAASISRGATAVKYITFTHDGDNSDVCGYTKFARAGQYRGSLPASPAPGNGDLFVSHIASDPNWWTGIGLVNLTGLTKKLTLRCSNAQTTSLTIRPNCQQAFLVRDLFGGEPQTSIASAVVEGAAGLVGLELFGRDSQMAGIQLNDRTSTILYFPHIHSDSEWWTGLVIYNPGNSSATLTITPYSATGTVLTPQNVTVPAESKYVGFVRDLDLPADSAWLKVISTRQVTGFELFGTWDGLLLAGFSTVHMGRFSGVFPKVEDDGWTGIALVNTTEASASVTLTAYDDNGGTVADTTIVLPPHAKMVEFVEDLFAEDIAAATCVGFTSSEYLAGFQLNGSSDDKLLDGLPAQAGWLPFVVVPPWWML